MLTGAQRAALMLELINRHGSTVALCAPLATLQGRNPAAVGVPTDATGAEIAPGPGAVLRVQIKLVREKNESQVRDLLHSTALEGEPNQYTIWNCTGEDYPLLKAGDKFLHRGVSYRILRLLENESGDALVSCALICDVEM